MQYIYISIQHNSLYNIYNNKSIEYFSSIKFYYLQQ